MDLTDEQLQKVSNRLARDVEDFLRDRTVEPHYDAEAAAAILHVSVRTVWRYIDAGARTEGREGIYPVVKLTHKAVRIPASSINRFLKAHTLKAPRPQLQEA
jgi:hypothetical protein